MATNLDMNGCQAARARARALARRFQDEVRQEFGNRVRAVRLFVSAARGDWGSDSDIDVMVLIDEVAEKDREWLARGALTLGVLEQGIVLQPTPMAEHEFARLIARERRFAMDVETEGIAL